MMIAPALAVAHSGRFQSPLAASRASGTEIGLARAGYAVAVLASSAFHSTAIPGTGMHPGQNAFPGSLEMGVGAAAPRETGGVAVRMAGDLSPRGARSRRAGLESSRQPLGESRRNRGAN